MLEIVCLEPNKKYKAFVIIGQVFQVAYTIFGTLLIAVLTGYFIDRWFTTSPCFIIFGSIVGIIQSFRELIRIGRVKDD